MAALIFCRRLAESDVTVTPSVSVSTDKIGDDNQVAHLVSFSTTLAFITNMTEKCKCTSLNAMQVKN